MPANRSRTENWKDALNQLLERGGALEVTIERDGASPTNQHDVVWRCRLLSVSDKDIVIETPAAGGRSLRIGAQVNLVVAMTIGQNRWMFHSRSLGYRVARAGNHEVAGLIIACPVRVERCPRRQFFRISTTELHLASVQCWPLLDPTSVVAAETANRAMITERLQPSGIGPGPADETPDSILLPDVGPMFSASLLNVSGGGLGLLVPPDQASAMQRNTYTWMRIDLTPLVPIPLALTAKRAHEHTDSHQNIVAGYAFDFAHHPAHQKFVADILGRYLESLQQGQQRRAAGA